MLTFQRLLPDKRILLLRSIMTFTLVNYYLTTPGIRTIQSFKLNYNPIKNNNIFQNNRRIVISSCSLSSTSSSTLTATTTTKSDEIDNSKNVKKKQSKGKDLRREFIGLAKNVDRGQYKNVYNPGAYNNNSGNPCFKNTSGLPYSTDNKSKLFTVLGIESSCDDTGVAIVRSDGVILGEALKSQHDVHAEHGGVVPGLARDEHEKNIDLVLEEALQKANMTLEEIDGIGVTVGPGLEICLRVGCDKAKELAIQYNKPFVGVHHLEAHILITRMLHYQNLPFPFLALLVSGGHCQILQCHDIGRYSVLGGTMDDSIGEAYDKIARLLGLDVPNGGGPAIEQLAKDGDFKSVPLPLPLQRRKHDCDFSYAGLKTSVRLAALKLCKEQSVDNIHDLSHMDKANIAASFQHVAIQHIEQKLSKAISLHKQKQQEESSSDNALNSLAVVGGVASNMELRTRLQKLCDLEGFNMVVPPPKLCTDQGSMSAWAAIERFKVGSSDDPKIQEVFPRYPFVKF